MFGDQQLLFEIDDSPCRVSDADSSTFVKNLDLPVHRWFRYSAGFSAQWVESVLREHEHKRGFAVFDPFAGSGTTLLAAEVLGVQAWGVDAHPFVGRIAKAKLEWRSDPEAFMAKAREARVLAAGGKGVVDRYAPLIRKCYTDASLATLDTIRQAVERVNDGTPSSELVWLALVSILRKCSRVGTAQWQYVLPKKQKRVTIDPLSAFSAAVRLFYEDMRLGRRLVGPRAQYRQSDARRCAEIPDACFDLVITSPPYPNNYDYADATRLEMTFFGEIGGWSDLQLAVRRHLIRSCTQHVPERAADLAAVCADPLLAPIAQELGEVCQRLAEVREGRGGRKTYHLMVACYFLDLAKVWRELRRVCKPSCRVCFVVGDSAPYGVYVSVVPWLGALAEAAGFKAYHFEKTRDRNVKWKNRKHRVPLQEGRLWVEG